MDVVREAIRKEQVDAIVHGTVPALLPEASREPVGGRGSVRVLAAARGTRPSLTKSGSALVDVVREAIRKEQVDAIVHGTVPALLPGGLRSSRALYVLAIVCALSLRSNGLLTIGSD